ncbi:3-oxoacyl-[acyl-carrier-protein] synthase II [Oxalobacteraceae bacterium GrIS 1.11]
MPENLVITAAAAVTPYGIGVAEFARGMAAGAPEATPLPGWHAGAALAATVPAYDARALLATRVISNFDRLTRHVCVATQQLQQSLGLDGAADGSRVSMVCGSSGPLQSIMEIDLQTIAEPSHLQPSLIPNLVFSAPASYAALRHGIRGSCITLTEGVTASLQAFAVAAAQLQAGRVDLALVCGAEEATPAYALYRAASGTIAAPLTEGAVIFALERAEHAALAGRASLARLLACAHVFAPGDSAGGLAACLRQLRRQAGKQLAEVGVVCAEAAPDLDAFGLAGCRRVSLEERLGDCGAMYASLAALNALCRPDIVPGEVILLLQTSAEGVCAAMLLQKHRTLEA